MDMLLPFLLQSSSKTNFKIAIMSNLTILSRQRGQQRVKLALSRWYALLGDGQSHSTCCLFRRKISIEKLIIAFHHA
jgi:hypothetical protein